MARIDTISINDIPAQTNDYAPIPAGEYIATIKDAEVKVTKDGTGQYIKLKLQIDAPSNTGRVIFSNLNIQNKSEAAERIGRQQLGEIMRALGLSSVADTDQLVGGTVGIKVPFHLKYVFCAIVKTLSSQSAYIYLTPSYVMLISQFFSISRHLES
jgi:hypothetical protein